VDLGNLQAKSTPGRAKRVVLGVEPAHIVGMVLVRRTGMRDEMKKPLLYDVFCGAGGCTKGYQRAGFYVVGVDKDPQPRYPGDDFIQMDALEFLAELLNGRWYPEPALISTSPPCQVYSRTKSLSNGNHPDLVGPVRASLQAIGLPYVIENVPGAPLVNPITLCGTMFDLQVIRHRLFETEPVLWWPPRQCQHIGVASSSGRGKSKNNPIGYAPGTLDNFDYITVAGNDYIMADGHIAMDIDWMIKKELSQAIPPAYTGWLGAQILEKIR